MNFETGFAGRIDAYADGTGGSCGDRLDERCIQTEATKNLGGLVAARIIANGTTVSSIVGIVMILDHHCES